MSFIKLKTKSKYSYYLEAKKKRCYYLETRQKKRDFISRLITWNLSDVNLLLNIKNSRLTQQEIQNEYIF